MKQLPLHLLSAGRLFCASRAGRYCPPVKLLLMLLLVAGLTPARAQDERKPRGATVNEGLVQTTIYVDAATGNDVTGSPYKTFKAALARAGTLLAAGTPTKIVLNPGTYREGDLDTGTDPRLLVIEGKEKGTVILSGSDEVPLGAWTDEGGGVYSIPWTRDWYFHDGNWGANGPRKVLGHRKEMIFVNGKLLEQVMLENWSYTHNTTTGEGRGTWSYQGYLGTGVLKDGSYGVSDKSHGARLGKLFVKFPAGTDPATAKIEVATRVTGLKVRKSNVVVRNLVVEHYANKTDRNDGEIPFILQTQDFFNWREEFAIRNALLEDCEFRWNNGTGYNLTGNINVTLKRTFAHHNGGNGCTSAYTAFSVWENLEASNNNWRVYDYGGKDSWYVAGHKLGWCAKYMTIRGYKAFDNAGAGVWTDGNSYYMDFFNIEAKGNKCGIFVEITSGPTRVENSHFYDNREEGVLIVEGRNTTIRNCVIENNGIAQIMAEFKDFPRLNTYPAEYTGGPTIKNPDGSIPHETKGVYVYNNVIRSNKGAASFLTFPSLQYSYKPEVYEAFLNKEYKGDSNTYLNPASAAMFVLAKSRFGNLNQWKERLRAEFTDHAEDQEVHSKWDAYLPNPPAAPGSLRAAVPAAGQINLTWKDRSDNESGFIIQRKVDNGAFQEAGRADADATSFADSGLDPEVSYIYRVYSYNADGNSYNASNEAATVAGNSPLPAGWVNGDVGEVSATGNASYVKGDFIVNASGLDIYGETDEFHFVYQPLDGDGEIVARVKSMTNTHPYVKSGVMMRAALTGPSVNVAVTASFRNLAEVTRRLINGGPTAGTGAAGALPRWVKLVRQGNTFTGYESPDGVAWKKVEEIRVQMPARIYAGLAATSHEDGIISTTHYDNVSFTPTAPGPPRDPANFLGMYNPETGHIDLSWTDNANNESGYRLERRSLTGTYAPLTTLPADATAFSDASVAPGQTYAYRLQAFNDLGASVAREDTVAAKLLGERVLLTTTAAREIRRTKSTNVLETAIRADNIWAGRLATGVVGAVVYPFRLPPIGPDQLVSAASFKVRIEGITPDVNVITDLWGLPYRATDAVLTADYFDGVLAGANQANATRIQSIFARGGSVTTNEQRTTTAQGNESLAAFLNAQYASGAKGGEWVFIRINCSTDQENNRLLFDHAADNDGFIPEIRITITDRTVPPAPGNVAAVSVSPTAVRLTWGDNAFDETAYVVERREGSGPFSVLATLAPGTTGYLDQNLLYNRTYGYRVYAVNVVGNSAPSAAGTATTGLSATLTPSDDTFTQEQFPTTRMGTDTQIVTFKENGGFTRMGYAKFSLAGVDLAGVESATFTVQATAIMGGTPPVRVAGYRDGLVGESWSEATLNWNLGFGVNADGTFIAAQTDALGGSSTDGAVMSRSGNTFTFSGAALAGFIRSQASPDQSVTFLFRGDFGQVFFASKENGTVAGPTLQITYKNPLPNAPTALVAESNNAGKITLTWTDHADHETGYVVERRTRNGAFAVRATLPANQTTFADENLPESTAFFYRVAAYNIHGNSAYSSEVSAATRFSLTPPANLEVNNAKGTCGAVVDAGTPAVPGDFTVQITALRSDGLALSAPYPVGTTAITWKATNEYSQTAEGQQTVKVLDAELPVIEPLTELIANNDKGACAAALAVKLPQASDNCALAGPVSGVRSDNLALSAPYPVGMTTLTWTVTDAAGNKTEVIQRVTVLDKESPVVAVKAQKTTLWTPNFNYRTIRVTDFVTGISDNCQGIVSVTSARIASVSSDEAENAPESGNTSNDIVIAADCRSVNLRAERSGIGNGRVYTITVAYTDGAGNPGTADYEVHVPVDINISKLAVKDAVAYTRNSNCPVGPVSTGRLSTAPVVENTFSLLVTPNPTSGKITARFPAGGEAGAGIVLVDMLGKAHGVARRVLDGDRLELDLGALPAGVYLLHVRTAAGSGSVRVMKQ